MSIQGYEYSNGLIYKDGKCMTIDSIYEDLIELSKQEAQPRDEYYKGDTEILEKKTVGINVTCKHGVVLLVTTQNKCSKCESELQALKQ